ncbi:hypothetical protein BHM03_00057546 [Ensete ventricosum]|nr:hypothetical protein BHM03_00057546 [Ensete ventricosum]
MKVSNTLQLIDLLVGDTDVSLRAHWITLKNSTQVWSDGANTTEFERGVLNLNLAQQLYGSPSEVLIDRATKSLVWGDMGSLPLLASLFLASFLLPYAVESSAQAFRRDPGHPQWHHGAFHDVQGTVRDDVRRMLHTRAEVFTPPYLFPSR